MVPSSQEIAQQRLVFFAFERHSLWSSTFPLLDEIVKPCYCFQRFFVHVEMNVSDCNLAK